jgi:hypothetical protein
MSCELGMLLMQHGYAYRSGSATLLRACRTNEASILLSAHVLVLGRDQVGYQDVVFYTAPM